MQGTSETEPCPACNSLEYVSLFTGTDRLYRTTDQGFQIVECRRCRLIRLFPRPLPSELPAYYPANYWYAPEEALASRMEEAYRRFVLRDHIRFVRKALAQTGDPKGLVLDVGCGGGLFLGMLAEQGVRVTGLDFCLDAGVIAWRRNLVPAVCGTLSQAPFAPRSCAAVTMFHVLEHLYEPSSYLDAAHDLLKPDGRLIVQVPNAACWQFLLLGEHWSGVDIPRHLLNFRPADLELLLAHSGFEVVRRKYFSLRDNPAGFATSLAPSLDPMARRIRQIPETPAVKLLKDLLYFALVVASVPATLLEAACHAGSTIMVEARKKP